MTHVSLKGDEGPPSRHAVAALPLPASLAATSTGSGTAVPKVPAACPLEPAAAQEAASVDPDAPPCKDDGMVRFIQLLDRTPKFTGKDLQRELKIQAALQVNICRLQQGADVEVLFTHMRPVGWQYSEDKESYCATREYLKIKMAIWSGQLSLNKEQWAQVAARSAWMMQEWDRLAYEEMFDLFLPGVRPVYERLKGAWQQGSGTDHGTQPAASEPGFQEGSVSTGSNSSRSDSRNAVRISTAASGIRKRKGFGSDASPVS